MVAWLAACMIGLNFFSNTDIKKLVATAITTIFYVILVSGQCRQPTDGYQNSNCDANEYMWSGFLHLQSAIDTALLRVKT